MEHLRRLVSLFALVFADFQTNFSVCFADGQPIHIFKGKEGVHKADLTVNVGYIKRLRGNIKRLCQRSRSIRLRFAGASFLLRQTHIGVPFGEADSRTKIFCVISRGKREREPFP